VDVPIKHDSGCPNKTSDEIMEDEIMDVPIKKYQ
jgi:hypothetical protein